MINQTTIMRPSRDEAINNFWGLAEEVINRFADKEYVVAKNGKLTYKEANHNANVIYTVISGIDQPKRLGIGLFLKDTLKIIPAMIGSLKAGNYFVALDVNFPEATIKSIIDTAAIKIIIADDENLEHAKALAGNDIAVISYDDIDFTIDISNPKVNYKPEDWVQILFTSGSTGEPKGAIEDYRYLANAAYIKKETHHYDSSDRILQMPNFTFSGAHTIVFGALFMGVTLCFYNVKEDGFNGMADWIRQENITCYNSTATIFRTWAGTLNPVEKFPTVRFARTGSEKLSINDIDTLKRHFPNLEYFRLGFASTETQAVTSQMFPIGYNFQGTEIPCGVPNVGLQVLINDENGNEVPIGKEGEIVVYGDTLARGYINNPQLTKEKFIPDPDNPVYQYYKTGDLGKIREDGMLVHLGRIDNMIKIKGVRIELNSIEKHMLLYPGILQTAFHVFDDNKGNKKLTAYFTTEKGINIPVSDLRKYLSEHLPVHLLPHYFIQMEQFPMTRTGKLDKNQLPRPTMKRPPLSNPYVAPTNELESTLVRIWEDEIGVTGIGVSDDFFDLGGDSLIGVVLFIRIEQELGRNLPVSTLLTASTVQIQAELINREASPDDFSPLITINEHGSNLPLFFIPGKGGYPTRIRHLAKLLDRETPIHALQDLLGIDKPKSLRRVESIAAFYLNQIRKVAPHGPYVLIGESMGGKIALEMAHQLAEFGDEVPVLALLDTYNFGVAQISNKGLEYFWMLLKKHLTILFRSGRQGRLDYIKFYRETIRDTLKQQFSGGHININEMEKNNIAVSQKYQPRPYSGRVILFKALRGLHTENPTNGWDKVEIGELVIHPLDCYHGSILFEPAVSDLAKTLNLYLQGKQQDKPISQ